MKNWGLIAITIGILVALILSSINCTFKRGTATSNNPANSSEPLSGNWAMSRISIEPPFPAAVPGFIVDQIIKKSPTWIISSNGNQLNISYDERSTWFNPMGINVNTNATSSSESSDKKSCTFTGGGKIQAASLPGALMFVATIAGNIQDIAINYTDKVDVTLVSQNQISAKISYSASGKYRSAKGMESINYQGLISYSGTRKE